MTIRVEAAGERLFAVGTVVFQISNAMSGLDNVVTNSVADQVTYAVAIEAAHDVSTVRFDCLDANVKNHGDFLATLSFSQ